ncbi:MAG: hypothetical protein PUH53_02345 [Mycoplasma sp.]|nr:hypothetical protein [Mycoplasma sp.]MDY4543842.1 hypothetical protein [Bacilli bacterium]MDY4618442.1 hypothetical protein [Bacilli bacterium]
MKKKKFFKSKTQMIIYIILFVIFIVLFIYFGTLENTTKKTSDSDKFKNEYKEVNEDNVFVYLNAAETLDYIKKDNILILFGMKNNSFVGNYANILNEVAKNVGIEKIYYYDLTEDRKIKNGTYQSIVNYLKDYAVSLDDGSKNIYAPSLLVKNDGIITYFDDEDAIVHGETNANDYFDNYRTNLKKITLKSVLEDYKKNENKSN